MKFENPKTQFHFRSKKFFRILLYTILFPKLKGERIFMKKIACVVLILALALTLTACKVGNRQVGWDTRHCRTWQWWSNWRNSSIVARFWELWCGSIYNERHYISHSLLKSYSYNQETLTRATAFFLLFTCKV